MSTMPITPAQAMQLFGNVVDDWCQEARSNFEVGNVTDEELLALTTFYITTVRPVFPFNTSVRLQLFAHLEEHDGLGLRGMWDLMYDDDLGNGKMRWAPKLEAWDFVD